MMLSIVLGSILAILFYCYVVWFKGYFSRRGIKHPLFTFPFIGNSSTVLTREVHSTEAFNRMYHMFPDQKYIGFMHFTMPFIMITDLNLLKQVIVKDFDHFVNRNIGVSEMCDPLLSKTLVSLKDNKWKAMRSTIGPAFASLKIKHLLGFVEKVAQNMNEYLLQKVDEQDSKERRFVEVEMNDVFSRYSSGSIATSAFGIEFNFFSDRENKFFEYGKLAADMSGIQVLKLAMQTALPKLCSLLKIRMLSPEKEDFFRQFFMVNMKKRQESNLVRHDMVQMILEIKKASDYAEFAASENTHKAITKAMTDDDWTAQAVAFFIAGFEASTTVLSYAAHELAMNQHVQKRLQEEIDAMVKEKGHDLNYSDLASMKFLDMVISEALRKWPPILFVERKCTKRYTLPPPSESSKSGYNFEIGGGILIPIYCIHRDPKYYPNPDKFDPERFSDENKKNLNPAAYIPFGVGPRNCIGYRYALMTVKTAMFHLLAKFDIVATAKTENPIELATDAFFLKAKKGFWVGLVPRN